MLNIHDFLHGPSKSQMKKNRQAKNCAGDVFEVIEVDKLPPVVGSVTWDEDPELLCSYNWQSPTLDGMNAIYVPGAPPKWQEPTLPLSLQMDSGYVPKDYNYARRQNDPYSSMFSALGMMNPNYQFDDVDILAGRNSLRTLLDFVQGKSTGEFRFDMHIVSNTLVIIRNEDEWWALCNGHTLGFNFEKVFTLEEPGMEDATNHYRAIRYSMGPLNIVCRFEADAYDDNVVLDNMIRPDPRDVNAGLQYYPSFNPGAPLNVIPRGRVVQTAELVEIKTKKQFGRSRASACLDQLWFGRTSLLYIGEYAGSTGVIEQVKYENATERIKKWETEQQLNLRKLASLLGQLRFALKNQNMPNRAAVLVRSETKGPLFMRMLKETKQVLGEAFIKRHWESKYANKSDQGDVSGRVRGGNPEYGQSFSDQPSSGTAYSTKSFEGSLSSTYINTDQSRDQSSNGQPRNWMSYSNPIGVPPSSAYTNTSPGYGQSSRNPTDEGRSYSNPSIGDLYNSACTTSGLGYGEPLGGQIESDTPYSNPSLRGFLYINAPNGAQVSGSTHTLDEDWAHDSIDTMNKAQAYARPCTPERAQNRRRPSPTYSPYRGRDYVPPDE